jgi:hypothetical protein
MLKVSLALFQTHFYCSFCFENGDGESELLLYNSKSTFLLKDSQGGVKMMMVLLDAANVNIPPGGGGGGHAIGRDAHGDDGHDGQGAESPRKHDALVPLQR